MERQIKDMKLNKTIDYTLLRTDAGEDEIIDLCEQAKSHGYASICVNPSYVKFCAHQLAETDVKVCAVVGFPLGQTTEHVKAYEASEALQNGASEIDAVMNVPWLKNVCARKKHKDKAISQYVAGLKRFVKSCHRRKKDCTTKLILECCLLTADDKILACKWAKAAGIDFVKTSTGFSKGGATVEDVALLRKTVGKRIGVKASGGIRTKEDALKMIEAGANRIGTSALLELD